ncbi:cytochrome P450 [Paraburkholderia phenoliruptrix]|uniref:cytochrome P450 n=1 Tax=Paraburkholderia phenoliruptrix TaxID=252970 RepID=UPI00285E8949|nr:cytochrome P450 [Paraburkholderia phenoliruptrix]MDR6390327.1 cytochrome P450 [Paraburkholderia phenoliruptrix]
MNREMPEPESFSVLPSIIGTGSADPYPLYEWLRTHRPLCRDASGVWLASSHALVTRILDDARFSARPPPGAVPLDDPLGYTNMVVFQTGEAHERLRRFLAPLFSRKALLSLQAFIDDEVARLIDQCEGLPRFDLVAHIASVLPVHTICRLLGFPDEHGASYLQASAGAWQLISGAPMSAQERALAAVQTETFIAQVESFMLAIEPDVVPDHAAARFLRLEQEGGMGRREMLVNVLFLFIAGYGTTLLSIGNSIAALLRAPRAWQALKDNVSLVPQAVRELYRYDPAVQSVFRYAWDDVEIDGYRIRRGERVMPLIGAANRDPAAFAAADEIRFEREAGRSLTFGAGPHSCMGLALARMQLESLLSALMRRMPGLRLAPREQPRQQHGSFHGYDRLMVEH